ncbi:MAG: DUF2851 family protein [Candidatus Cloacimonas sp.]
MDEKFLYHIWDEGHLAGNLKTVSGKELKINYQGQFNTFRGPDFVNAIISLNGEDLQGAIEIHQNTQDWIKHAHQEDVHYNQVILHTVLNHNGSQPYTIKENGELIEILELKNQLSEDIQKLLSDLEDKDLISGNDYCDLLSAIDNDRLFGILAISGKQRFMSKVHRFNVSLSLSDFDQILYEGMMEAAGYDKNKFNLFQLAQSIPFAKLREWFKEGMTSKEMLSLLIGSSGLLPKSRNRLSAELYAELLSTYESQRYYARKLDIDWQLFRIRPGNHPVFRLILLSEFLYNCLPDGLLNYFLNNLELAEPKPSKRYQTFSQLFKPQQEGLLHNRQGLGITVINNIYINIYLPILYLYYQKLAKAEMTESILQSYVTFKALPENYITRFMCNHINSSQVKAVNSKTLYQQGLIDIYYRFCRYHLCSECLKNI